MIIDLYKGLSPATMASLELELPEEMIIDLYKGLSTASLSPHSI